MQYTVPSFGPREVIVLVIAVGAIMAFLLAAVKLAFTKHESPTVLEGGKDHIALHSRNNALLALAISGILLAFIANFALAQVEQQWVYLGPGFNSGMWNFENVDSSKQIAVKSIVKARVPVHIRSDHFGNFTNTWLSSLGSPEPPVIGTIDPGGCAIVLEFASVGFNRVWMRVKPSPCN